MKFEIWQLPISHPNKFMHSEWCKKNIQIRDYVMVYSGEIKSDTEDINEFLEELFYIFNNEHPADYHAASMSVSDIVCLIGKCNKRFWFYVDGEGFKEVEANV